MRKSTVITFALLISLTVGCGLGLRGAGEIVSENRVISSDFDTIELRGSGDLTVEIGMAPAVVVETDSAVIDRVTTSVEDGRLVIDQESTPWRDVDTLRIAVTTPSLERLELSGSGTVWATGLTDGLAVEISGSGDVTLEGEVDLLDVLMSGDGSVDAGDIVAGSAMVGGDGSGAVDIAVEGHRLDVDIDGSMDVAAGGAVEIAMISIGGSGEFSGRELTADVAEVDISGSGDVAMSVVDRLDATVSGSGDVVYWGTPALSEKVSGSGTVRRG